MEKKKIKVLIIDDEKDILNITVDFINFTGEMLGIEFECRTAKSAEDGAEIISNGFVPDLVISDYTLPGMDGVGLYRHLQEFGFFGEWIFMSGDPDKRLLLTVEENGLCFIYKPFSLKKFQEVLGQSIANL